MTTDESGVAVDRRYICTGCEGVVRARWRQWGDAYPGYFSVGCECTTVPVVPQMTQAETPDNWAVERPECCRDVDVNELETVYGNEIDDYRCPECGATYRWDGTMSTAPDGAEVAEDEDQTLLTDGGVGTPQDFKPSDSQGDNGLEICAVCWEQLGGEGGHHGEVYTQSGKRYENFYDSEPGEAPFFCPECWPKVQAARKAEENKTLGEFA